MKKALIIITHFISLLIFILGLVHVQANNDVQVTLIVKDNVTCLYVQMPPVELDDGDSDIEYEYSFDAGESYTCNNYMPLAIGVGTPTDITVVVRRADDLTEVVRRHISLAVGQSTVQIEGKGIDYDQIELTNRINKTAIANRTNYRNAIEYKEYSRKLSAYQTWVEEQKNVAIAEEKAALRRFWGAVLSLAGISLLLYILIFGVRVYYVDGDDNKRFLGRAILWRGPDENFIYINESMIGHSLSKDYLLKVPYPLGGGKVNIYYFDQVDCIKLQRVMRIHMRS